MAGRERLAQWRLQNLKGVACLRERSNALEPRGGVCFSLPAWSCAQKIPTSGHIAISDQRACKQREERRVL